MRSDSTSASMMASITWRESPRSLPRLAILRALSRIANLGKDLGDSRQVMLAIIDADVESLRMPREDGTYRWASLQREEGSRVKDEKDIERVSTEKELREVT